MCIQEEAVGSGTGLRLSWDTLLESNPWGMSLLLFDDRLLKSWIVPGKVLQRRRSP
jgi:hypothetical protein